MPSYKLSGHYCPYRVVDILEASGALDLGSNPSGDTTLMWIEERFMADGWWDL